MRLLLVTEFPFPGVTGSPTFLMQLADGMRRRGHEVSVLRYGGRRTRRLERRSWRDVEVVVAPLLTWPVAATAHLRALRPDVVWTHGSTGLTAIAACARALRMPLLHEVHALPGPAPPGVLLRTRFKFWLTIHRELLTPRLADAVVILSERMREPLRDAGVRAERMHLGYPPVDLAAFRAEPRAPRAHAPLVLYAGNFWSYQGVPMLIDAIPLVLRERPDVRFRLVGGAPAEIEAVWRDGGRALAANLSIEPRVELDALPAVLHDADLLVIPRPDVPINRTTAHKLGEYLASGRAIVATDVGDHRRILGERDCGSVSACTARALADSMVAALNDPERSHARAVRAAQVADELFSLERALTLRERLLEEVSRPRGAAR